MCHGSGASPQKKEDSIQTGDTREIMNTDTHLVKNRTQFSASLWETSIWTALRGQGALTSGPLVSLVFRGCLSCTIA